MLSHLFPRYSDVLARLVGWCGAGGLLRPRDLEAGSAGMDYRSQRAGSESGEPIGTCSAAPFLKPYAVPWGSPAFFAAVDTDSLTLFASRGSSVQSPVPGRHLTNLRKCVRKGKWGEDK